MPQENAKRRSQAVWGSRPAGWTHASEHEVGSAEYFRQVLQRRSTDELPFLEELIPFDETSGKRVVELGCGAGYDAYRFCVAGADYVGVDLTPENPFRTRTHLRHMGFRPALAIADAERLPFTSRCADVVFSNGVLHHTPDMRTAFGEAWRLLRPGGTFHVIVYHRDSFFYWVTLGLFDHLIAGGFRKRSFRDRVAMIEETQSGELPLVNVYSRRQVRRLLTATGFTVERLVVRKLQPQDLPPLGPLRFRLYEKFPRVLTALGKVGGWYVVATATKPQRSTTP